MNFGRLLAVWHARNLEFLRDRSTLIFNFLFPLALVVAFAVIFGGQPRALFKVDVIAPADAALDAGLHPFVGTRYVDFVRIDAGDLDSAIRKVERHQVDLLLDLRAAPRYWINEDSPKGYLAEKLLLESAAGRATREPVTGAAVRYVDWLLPGVLGMNMMFSCLFGFMMAARFASEELANGAINLASWPMMLLSGVWFSLEGAPAWLQAAAKALPLTQMLDAARAVMLDGAGPGEVLPNLGWLAAMTLLFLGIAAAGFRWRAD